MTEKNQRQDFEPPITYDPLLQGFTNKMNDDWISWISSFYETLITYLSSTGVFPPQLTTVERDQIKTPKGGQTIYNVTLNSNQYFKVGTGWVSY